MTVINLHVYRIKIQFTFIVQENVIIMLFTFM